MRLYFEDPAGRRLAIETDLQEYSISDYMINDNHRFIKVSAGDYNNLVAEIDFNAWSYGGEWLIDYDELQHIKVNLPACEGDYITGNGEGVFVLVTKKVKEAHDSDETGTHYRGILDNDSYYYIDLTAGEEIPIEMRGVNKPVVPYTWLINNYTLSGFTDYHDDKPTEAE